MTMKIIEKAIAEAALEQKYDDVSELEEMEVEVCIKEISKKVIYSIITLNIIFLLKTRTPNDDEDEKPSCVMCDQTDDLVKCRGCNGDLYCIICFEDNHDEFELKTHKKVPFKHSNKMIPE